MAKVISTRFDDTVEESVSLEQIDNKPPPVQTTLKNAENVYKSFLYLRDMYSMFPQKEQVLTVDTINSDDYVSVDKPIYANFIILNSIDPDNISYVKFNGKEFAINPLQIIELPIIPKTDSDDGDALEIKGKISYILKLSQEY